MLDSVDPKVRLSKGTELVDKHLQSIHVAEKITQEVEGQLSKSQKEFLLRQQMRTIKEELSDNDDDEDDVAALERKMPSAGMPSNIWKHAQRELRAFAGRSGKNCCMISARGLHIVWTCTSKILEICFSA